LKTQNDLVLIAYGMSDNFLSSLVFQVVHQVKRKLSKTLKISKIKIINETEAYQKWGFIELPVTVLYCENKPLLQMAGFQPANSIITQIQNCLKKEILDL
jgi:thioredoxin-like negative regulator of GroEL